MGFKGVKSILACFRDDTVDFASLYTTETTLVNFCLLYTKFIPKTSILNENNWPLFYIVSDVLKRLCILSTIDPFLEEC